MYNVRCHLEALSCWGLLAILLSAMSWAQVGREGRPNPSSQHEVLDSWQARLSDAADRTLAVALADKPWMNTPEVSAAGGNRLPSTGTAPAVRLRRAVARIEQLRPTIEPILREEGVPAELSAVVLVESGGQIAALSPKGARGVWQLMPDTARRYGLAVSDGRDERLNVTKSTRAAARYLRDLYQRFGDWQLAFAAYNAGEQAVGHAMVRSGHRDFIAIQDALPQETRNYVPAVLAAMERLQDHGFSKPTHVIYASVGSGD